MALNPDTLPGELTVLNLGIDGAFTANAAGTGVSVADFDGKLKVILNAAAATNSNQSLTVKLQHSIDDNASNYADFDPAVTFTAIAVNGGATTESIELDMRETKAWVRLVANESAAGNGRAYSVIATGKRTVTG